MNARAARAAVAALLAAVLAGCTLPAPEPEDQDPPAPGPRASSAPAPVTAAAPRANASAQAAAAGDIPGIVRRVEPSVVTIAHDEGTGSGVVWSGDGVVVTNAHVVGDVREVEVAFFDGKRADGRVRATDPDTDLAVVDVERRDLQPATFQKTLPAVGELAVAMGSPLGFQNTITAGIISGLHREIPGSADQGIRSLVDLIQTDAAISPGNSGGALVNARGEVVGVNVAYIPPEQGAVAIGFAIPGATAVDVVGQLLRDGRATHSYLGVQPDQVTREVASPARPRPGTRGGRPGGDRRRPRRQGRPAPRRRDRRPGRRHRGDRRGPVCRAAPAQARLPDPADLRPRPPAAGGHRHPGRPPVARRALSVPAVGLPEGLGPGGRAVAVAGP